MYIKGEYMSRRNGVRDDVLDVGRPKHIEAIPPTAVLVDPADADGPLIPSPDTIPDWSDETIRLLENLTNLERGFVEWMTTGRSAADSYRLASGRRFFFDKRANLSGSQLKNKPAVKEALNSALKDRGFGARFDREWKLQMLGSKAEKLSVSHDPEDTERLLKTIKLMAELQGEYVKKVEQEVTNYGDPKSGDVSVRISQILVEAKRLGVDGPTEEISGRRVVIRPSDEVGERRKDSLGSD